MSESLPGHITGAREEAAKLGGVASDYAAGEISVVDALNSKIKEAYSANRDLIDKLDTSTQNYYNAPKQGREMYQNIFNPFQRENLVSQYTGQQAIPMLSQANILGSRMGGIQGLVDAGVRGFSAESARAQGKAQSAQQNYQNLLNEYQLEQQMNATSTQEVTANGRKYLITLDKNGNIVKKQDMGSSGSGSGSGIEGLDQLIALLAGGIQDGGAPQNLNETDQVDESTPSFSYISPEAKQSVIFSDDQVLDDLLFKYKY